MDIFFKDPDEIPLPPSEMRLTELRAEPWPDGQRVRVYVETTPFQQRPHIDLIIYNAEARQVTATSIIEPMGRKLELTMHLRGQNPAGPFSLEAVLFYSQPKEMETQPGQDNPDPEKPEFPEQIVTVVDRKKIEFTPPGPEKEAGE